MLICWFIRDETWIAKVCFCNFKFRVTSYRCGVIGNIFNVLVAHGDLSVEWDLPEKLQEAVMKDNSKFEEWVTEMNQMRVSLIFDTSH